MSVPQSIRMDDLVARLPAQWPENLLPEIQARLACGGRTLVVLDDDPTGTQTVHGVAVLTEWSVEALVRELNRGESVFFVLTNSRSLSLLQAQALNREIGSRLREASRLSGRDFAVVSRSDSTLRGHYPGEVDALSEALGHSVDATLIIPFFLEGGRYTVDDVHYVAEGNVLTPASETQFAQDAVFGYRSSNLREWVEEKHGGRVSADCVRSIAVQELRTGGPRAVRDALMGLANGEVCVVNAVSMRDMEVFVTGLLQAESDGKRFLYRTAASFVQVRAGIEPRSLLSIDELNLPAQGGGLIAVGSYVPKTTVQVERLLSETGATACALQVEALLDPERRDAEIERSADVIDRAIGDGQSAVLFTSRRLVTGRDATQNLEIGRRVSESLVAVVVSLRTQPRYLIAKGGITSSDIATDALRVRRATVLGQILPGVPVWRTGPESIHPGLPYVVFPGNVGGDDALLQIVKKLDRNG